MAAATAFEMDPTFRDAFGPFPSSGLPVSIASRTVFRRVVHVPRQGWRQGEARWGGRSPKFSRAPLPPACPTAGTRLPWVPPQ